MVGSFLGLVGVSGLTAVSSAEESVPVAENLAYALSTRYAPFASWEQSVDVDALATESVSRYWRTADAIRSQRGEGDLPLAGLHLALDPGHLGGFWADYEGRRFRMSVDDYWVKEGDLVLEVAERLKVRLEAKGARVSLLRTSDEPANSRRPVDYLEAVAISMGRPADRSWEGWQAHGRAMRSRAIRQAIVVDELAERSRLVNEVIRPDALLSLHINAGAWPRLVLEPGAEPVEVRRLLESNHLHVLIFGCMSERELESAAQRERLTRKLLNGSGSEEVALGGTLANALAQATGLPPSVYDGDNAVRIDGDPYVFARNLMLLRLVECPTVMLEPYIANGRPAYARLQQALADRAEGRTLADDDILLEYTEAVVVGILVHYGGFP